MRYFLGTEFVIGATAIPLYVSLIAGIVLAVLTLWMVLAAQEIAHEVGDPGGGEDDGGGIERQPLPASKNQAI